MHSAKPGVIILRGFLKVGLEHLRDTLVGGNKTWAAVERVLNDIKTNTNLYPETCAPVQGKRIESSREMRLGLGESLSYKFYQGLGYEISKVWSEKGTV